MTSPSGKVYLVGAGPGDPELITVRGLAILQRADVVLHDRLVSMDLIAQSASGAKIINVGKIVGGQGLSQDQINELMVDHASKGKTVVRLKGGDPFIFGRGAEEMLACQTAGIECEVIAGVSSALSAPLAAGISLTQRNVSRSIAIVTAHSAQSNDTFHLDYDALARLDTLVVLMGYAKLRDVVDGLLQAGRHPNTPAAAIASATTPKQRTILASLGTIAEAVDQAALKSPMVVVVGEVASPGLLLQ